MFGNKRKLRILAGRIHERIPTAPIPPKLKRPRPMVRKIKIFSLLAFFTIGIILIIYAVFFSNYFKIKEIKIADEKNENIKFGEEITSSIGNTLGKSLFFTDTEGLQIKILDAFPEIEQVKVEKDWPSTLMIQFMEYPFAANIINESQNMKKNYIINSIGYVVKENFENQNLPYIRIKSDEPVNPENPIIEATKLNFILNTIVYFEDKFGMRVIEAQYKKIPRELHLLTEKNFLIWLDIQKPFENQLKALKKALVKLDIYNEPLQYIDLRIAGGNGDKIIYKRR